MQRFLIIILFSLIALNSCYSQNMYSIREAMDFFRTNKLSSGDWKKELTEDDIEGSPYLNDEFIKGTVLTKTKQKFVDVPLRYNIFNDQIEFKNSQNEVLAMATPEIIEAIEFNDMRMVYVPFTTAKRVKHGFFTIEIEGKASLYSQNKVVFKKAEKPAAYKDAVPAKFIKKPVSYFVKIETAQAKRANNKKELPEIFPDHQKEIAAFIKKNKTRVNKPEQLIELIQYYNSL